MHPLDRKPQGLEEVRELNKLFLAYLKRYVPERSERLGLPLAAIRPLGTASDEALEQLADFPHAIFRLDLDGFSTARIMDPRAFVRDPAHQALQLTVLVSVWNLTRKSRYSARLLLGMSDAEVKLLRATPLSELPRAALGADLVRCAFTEPDWLWPKLLTERGGEVKRQLLLIGLQPRYASSELAA